jgi:protein-arginine kinase activator protein McsA
MKCNLCLQNISSNHVVKLRTRHNTYANVCQLCVQNTYHVHLLHALEDAKAMFERARITYHNAANTTGNYIRFYNDITALSVSDGGIEYQF